jgi:hypothetical protein
MDNEVLAALKPGMCPELILPERELVVELEPPEERFQELADEGGEANPETEPDPNIQR